METATHPNRYLYQSLQGSGKAWMSLLSFRFGKRIITVMWGRRFRRITEREYTKRTFPFVVFSRGIVGPSWPAK